MKFKPLRALLAAAIALATFTTAQAKNVYVSTQASSDANSCLTQASACRTLDRGEAVAAPGDVVNLSGIFTQRTDLNKSGAPGNPITYQSLPGAHAVLDGGNITPSPGGPAMLRILRAHNIVIRNIEVRESPQKGILIRYGYKKQVISPAISANT
jgi:hypothetical protein